jgi:hypothetical protein
MIFIGAVFGMLWGWVISPTKYVDTKAEHLRSDYKADLVLMTAETYAVEHNLEWANYRLQVLGEESADEYVRQALILAERLNYSDHDIEQLMTLFGDLQTFESSGAAAEVSPLEVSP